MYDPTDGPDDIPLIQPLGPQPGFYWLRLQDTLTDEIEDIPIEGEDVIYWWSHGVGRCDCVRYRAFQQIRGKNAPLAECGTSRMRLLGIWDRGGLQIHPGE